MHLLPCMAEMHSKSEKKSHAKANRHERKLCDHKNVKFTYLKRNCANGNEKEREKATVDASALTPAHPLSLHKVHFGAVDMFKLKF